MLETTNLGLGEKSEKKVRKVLRDLCESADRRGLDPSELGAVIAAAQAAYWDRFGGIPMAIEVTEAIEKALSKKGKKGKRS